MAPLSTVPSLSQWGRGRSSLETSYSLELVLEVINHLKVGLSLLRTQKQGAKHIKYTRYKFLIVEYISRKMFPEKSITHTLTVYLLSIWINSFLCRELKVLDNEKKENLEVHLKLRKLESILDLLRYIKPQTNDGQDIIGNVFCLIFWFLSKFEIF